MLVLNSSILYYTCAIICLCIEKDSNITASDLDIDTADGRTLWISAIMVLMLTPDLNDHADADDCDAVDER